MQYQQQHRITVDALVQRLIKIIAQPAKHIFFELSARFQTVSHYCLPIHHYHFTDYISNNNIITRL